MTKHALNLQAVRQQFPALEQGWTLMDNAGGSAPLARVIDQMAAYMSQVPVQLGASYALSQDASRRLALAQHALAALLTAGRPGDISTQEVIVGPSATTLLGRLAQAMAPQLKPGDEIIVSQADHEANITPWTRLQERGVVIRWWKLDLQSEGLLLADLETLLGPRTRGVCVTHCSNLLGEVVPIKDVARLAHEAGAWICVDGVAHAPHRSVDVLAMDVDFYTLSLYKVFGPHLGLMFGRRELLLPLDNLNHSFFSRDEIPYKLQPGAYAYELLAGCTGIAAYLNELGGGDASDQDYSRIAAAYRHIRDHEHLLAGTLLDGLRQRADVRVLGRPEAHPEDRLPTVSFVVPGRQSRDIVEAMDKHRIGIRHGHFYAVRLVEALGLDRDDGVVRVSMAHYNTVDEVHRLLQALEEIL